MKKTVALTAVKTIAFTALLMLVLWYLMQVFTYPKSVENESTTGDFARERFNSFYSLERDTVDCVFIGTSGTDRYWLPALAWHDSGLLTYSLTSGSQHMAVTRNLIEETLKTQDAKLFIVDLRTSVLRLGNMHSSSTRRVTDNMRISRNWIDAIQRSRRMTAAGGGKQERLLSYLFTPYRYHSMWTTMTVNDLIDIFPKDKYMCYFGGEFVYNTEAQKPPKMPVEPADIPEENKALIDELAEYCKEKGITIVFMSTPISGTKKNMRKLAAAAEYARDAGFDVYDFNTSEMYDELGWDFDRDQYNKSHCNFRGAIKFTDHFSKILIDRYGLKDHRSDPGTEKYARWDEGYQAILGAAKRYMPDVYEEVVSGGTVN